MFFQGSIKTFDFTFLFLFRPALKYWTLAYSFYKFFAPFSTHSITFVYLFTALSFPAKFDFWHMNQEKWHMITISVKYITPKSIGIFTLISIFCQLYPPKDWLVESSLPSKFNPSIIRAVLEKLSSRNFQ